MSRPSSHSILVLLMEQDPQTISAASALLAEISECKLQISSSFAEALLTILESPPNLILFAHGLPGRDNLEVFNSIHSKYPSILLIVSLPEENLESMEEYKKAGARECIVKDANYITNLATAVKQVLPEIISNFANEETSSACGSSAGISSMLSAMEPGEKFLHYEIIEPIGEGGMGEVYKARDLKLGRTVAIKALPLRIRKDDHARKRFLREAQSASKLNHPGIITIHAIEETDDFQFIVMEYAEGVSLRTILEKGPLAFDRLIDIGIQITDALGKAHVAGLIHRDIKPANIMISAQNKIKILDFGLAKTMTVTEMTLENDDLTKTGAVVGTVHFMSPEQTRGEVLDARSDLFSLGSVLYQAATGQIPFRGSNVLAIMNQIVTEEPAPPSSIRSSLPSDFDSLIARALAKERDQRFANSEELLSALKDLIVAPERAAAADSRISIAVLYFENLGGLAEQEYLRDGLTEDVITELSKLEKLRVFPRSAVIAFRDKPVTAPEIGRKLKASYVLAGSVRKAGNRVRVTSQLVRGDSGISEWAERYDLEMSHVFDLQDEIARSLAKALSIRLSPAEDKALREKPATNAEAYDFYLQGRRLFRRGTRKDLESAAEMFQRAIDIEPNFALAFAGLAHVCGRIHRYHDQNPQWMVRGIEACDRAMKIEPNLPEALSARAYLHYGHKEYEESIRYAKMAIDRKRDCEGAYFALGLSLNLLDRLEEAAQLVDAAIENNGEDYNVYLPYVNVLTRLGKTDKARQLRNQHGTVLRMHLDWAPENARARVLLASNYAESGEVQRALDEVQKALDYSPNDASTLMNAACNYALMGFKTEALAALKKAVANGYRHADTLARDSDLTTLHGDPEFEALLKNLQ